MNKNNITALITAAKTKREQTFIKVKAVLQVMQAKSLIINFESVAKLAHVSKTWLYKEPLIAAEIKQARKKEGIINRSLNYQSLIEKQAHEIITLKEKNKLLQDQVRQLQAQLENVYGELYKIKNQHKLTVIK